MFVLPVIIITQTKVKYAKPLSVWITILAALYALGRWFLQQRPENLPGPGTVIIIPALVIPMGNILLWKGRQILKASYPHQE